WCRTTSRFKGPHRPKNPNITNKRINCRWLCKTTIIRCGTAISGRANSLSRSTGLSCQTIESERDAPQAFGEHLRIDAHPDADVIGHFEKAAWDDGGFVFGTKLGDELVGVCLLKAHKTGRTKLCTDHGQISWHMLVQKFRECSAVGLHNHAGPLADFVQLLKRDHAQ